VVAFEEVQSKERSMSAEAARSVCKIYEGDAVAPRLAQLGLQERYFSEAATIGHEKRSRCLPVHPASFGGQTMWAETLAALRTQCLDLNANWEIDRTRGYETVFNGRRRLSVAVVGGNHNTGEHAFDPPKTARPRGPITTNRVLQNHQLVFQLDGISDPTTAEDNSCVTWFFLMNARNDKLYSELSFPIVMGNRQRISQWAERILFTPLNLVGAVTPLDPDDAPDAQSNISVTRKK
jgi:hypothetical protein